MTDENNMQTNDENKKEKQTEPPVPTKPEKIAEQSALADTPSEPENTAEQTGIQPPSENSDNIPDQDFIDKLSRLTPGEAGIVAENVDYMSKVQSPTSGEEPPSDEEKPSDEAPLQYVSEVFETTKPQKPTPKPRAPRKKIDYTTGAPYYLRVAGTLTAICVCVALLLAVTNAVTSGKIAENGRKTASLAVSALFKVFDEAKPLDGVFEPPVTGVTAVKSGGKTVGYCVFVSQKGFGGIISLAVGVDASGSLSGVKILSMNETPGLGTRTGEDAFLSQFVGKTADMKQSELDAIAGATISSKAVYDGIKAALDAVAALPAADETAADTTSAESETAATPAETDSGAASEPASTAEETSTDTTESAPAETAAAPAGGAVTTSNELEGGAA